MAWKRQLWALIWKNFIIFRRNKCATFLEVCLPPIFALALVAIWATSTTRQFDTQHYVLSNPSKVLPVSVLPARWNCHSSG